jgi:hypothetical protein
LIIGRASFGLLEVRRGLRGAALRPAAFFGAGFFGFATFFGAGFFDLTAFFFITGFFDFATDFFFVVDFFFLGMEEVYHPQFIQLNGSRRVSSPAAGRGRVLQTIAALGSGTFC